MRVVKLQHAVVHAVKNDAVAIENALMVVRGFVVLKKDVARVIRLDRAG